MGAREVTFDEVSQLPVEWGGAVVEEFIDFNGHMNIERYFDLHCRALSVVWERFGVNDHYRATYRQGLFTIEQHLRYLSEAGAGEEIAIHLRVLDRSDKILHTMSYLTNVSRRQITNTVELTAAHVDLDTRRAVPFTAAAAAAIDRELARSAALPWEAVTCGAMGPRRSPRPDANHRSSDTGELTLAGEE